MEGDLCDRESRTGLSLSGYIAHRSFSSPILKRQSLVTLFTMRLSFGTAMLMAGAALADPLATVNPCPLATSTTYQPITITSQYQTYSTCYPTTACVHGVCSTNYPFETSSFVSSTIPNAWDGETGSSTLVTAIDQDITVSQFSATQTRYVTPSPTTIGRTIYVYEPTPVYLTIKKDFHAPYNELGPLAVSI